MKTVMAINLFFFNKEVLGSLPVSCYKYLFFSDLLKLKQLLKVFRKFRADTFSICSLEGFQPLLSSYAGVGGGGVEGGRCASCVVVTCVG